jgi:hypothetical protein
MFSLAVVKRFSDVLVGDFNMYQGIYTSLFTKGYLRKNGLEREKKYNQIARTMFTCTV